MFEDQRRFDVSDLGKGREPAHCELAEVFGVPDDDVNEEVVGTGDVVHADHLGEGPCMESEAVDLVRCVAAQPEGDHRLEPDAEGSRVDVGVEAEEDPIFLEAAHPFRARRWSDTDDGRQLLVRPPCILL